MKTRKVSISVFQIFIVLLIIILIVIGIFVIKRNIKSNEKSVIEQIQDFAGEGTKENPYQIANEEDLVKLLTSIRKGQTYKDKYFKLLNKIGLQNNLDFTSIKTTAEPIFEGIFDGNEKSITNLNINIETANLNEYSGLFGINKGTITNLRVIGTLVVNENLENTTLDVGMLTGKNEGIISSCKTDGSIVANMNKDTAILKVGGVTGENTGSITDTSSNVSISSNQTKAGITAKNSVNENIENSGELTNCSNTAEIKEETTSENYTAGICAENNNGNITSCTNNGKIQGKFVGGIVAYSNGNVVSCQNTAQVANTDEKSDNSEIAGGIAGIIENANIENCKNTGKILGLTDIGGIAGQNKGKIMQSTNEGEISKIEENTANKVYIGGIVGTSYENSSITNCKNYGKVGSSSDNLVLLGGICGYMYNSSTIEDCGNGGTLYGEAKIVTPNEDLETECKNCTNVGGGQVETTENGELYIGLIYGKTDNEQV